MKSSLFPQFSRAQIQLDDKLFSLCACADPSGWEALCSLRLRMRCSSLISNFLFPQFMRAQLVPGWWAALYALSLRMRSSNLMRSSLFPQPVHAQLQLDGKHFISSVCACAVPAWWEDLYSISLRMPSYNLMRSFYSLSSRMRSSSLMRSFLFSQFAHAQF